MKKNGSAISTLVIIGFGLLTLFFLSCSGGGGQGSPQKKSLLRGQVTGATQAEIIVQVFQKNILVSHTMTNQRGEFFFSLSSGNYDLVPAKEGYSFDPPLFNLVFKQDEEIAFNSHLKAYTLSGMIVGDIENNPGQIEIQGEDITKSPISASVTAQADQTFQFTGLYSGFYLLTPSLAGYAFTPPTIPMTIIGPTEVFSCTFKAYPIQQWAYETDGAISSSPALAEDGTIYIGSDDHRLYALQPNGQLKWSLATQGKIHSSPALAEDGTIYIGSADRRLYALYPNGSIKWSYLTLGKITSSPALGPDNCILIGSEDHSLYCLTTDGEVRWSYATQGAIHSSPAIGPDGSIYVGSADYSLYALDPNGQLKWTYTTLAEVYSSPAVSSDGTIYFGSNDHSLYALNQNGSLKWASSTGGKISSSPAVDTNGQVLVGSDDQLIYAFTSQGIIKWTYPTSGEISSSPALGSDGLVYVGSNDGHLYVFEAKDGQLAAIYTTEGPLQSSPTLTQEGSLLIGSHDGKVYNLTIPSEGLTRGGWPMFRRDQAHSGLSSQAALYTVAGTISGVGKGGTVVILSSNNQPVTQVVSGDDGSFSLNIPDGFYTLTPTRSGYFFEPRSLCIVVNGNDLLNLHLSSESLIGTAKWHFSTQEKICSSAALGPDSTIYVGSYDNNLYALYPEGNLKWKFTTGGSIFATPTIDLDQESVYIGSYDHYLYALDYEGREKWRTPLGDTILSTAVIGCGRTLLVGCNDRKLWAIDRVNGQQLWSTNLSNPVSTPALGLDGTIYVGAGSLSRKTGNLYAINPQNGHIQWAVDLCVLSRPAIGQDGTIYVTALDGSLHALYPSTGLPKWSYSTEGEIYSSPLLGPDKTIYFGSDDRKVYALTSNGSLKWTFTTQGEVRSSAAIGPDRTIYIGSRDNQLYALDPETGLQKWSFFTPGGVVTAIPLIAENGMVYIGSQNNIFYAIYGEGV